MSSEIQHPPNTYLVASGSSLGIPHINSRTPSSESQTGHFFFMFESYREPLTKKGVGVREPGLAESHHPLVIPRASVLTQ